MPILPEPVKLIDMPPIDPFLEALDVHAVRFSPPARWRPPSADGNFARLLGKYVRDEGVIPLEEAIRRLTSLPATNLNLAGRGRLAPEQTADLAIFDPGTIRDNATFDRPHQYATGMVHVFVNGVQVLKDGEHTGATPGRVVRGPGWRGN